MDPQEKKERLIETACAVLNATPDRRLNVIVLNKTLFYFDLASLRDRGQTVTGNSYIAIMNGPVVAKYPSRLVAELEQRRLARQIDEWDGAKPVLLERCPEHFQFLDSDAMALVSAVATYFAGRTSQQASDYSHDNPSWQLAWDHYRRTNRPSAINMRIAMQQIIEDDPWMELPLADDFELLADADSAAGLDW